MRFAVSLLIAIAFFGGGVWVIGGRSPPELWIRAFIYAAIFLTVGLVMAVVAYAERAARRERNAAHCRLRGYRYREEAALAEFIPAESNFDRNSRLESIAEGAIKGSPFAVLDLSYQVQSSSGEGGSTTHTVAQTVAVLAGQAPPGPPLQVHPLAGVERGLLSFLGVAPSVAAHPQAAVNDAELIAWFEQHYLGSWHDEAARARERILQLPLLRWLRAHPGLAWEMAAGNLLVWRPSHLIDADARDELVDEAMELAAILSAQADAVGQPASVPAIHIQPPRVDSLAGVFWRMAFSGFASWFVACLTGFGVFFVGVATGFGPAFPIPFLVTIMLLVLASWMGADWAIYCWISQPNGKAIER